MMVELLSFCLVAGPRYKLPLECGTLTTDYIPVVVLEQFPN